MEIEHWPNCWELAFEEGINAVERTITAPSNKASFKRVILGAGLSRLKLYRTFFILLNFQ